MAAGNLALLLLMIVIVDSGAFSLADVAYALVVVALIVARYIDITRFAGRTASAEPATLRHFRRYSVGLLVGAAAVWIAAHLVMSLL